MESLFVPLVLVGAIVWLIVSGRRRARPDASSDAARAHIEAERQKFNWYGGGKPWHRRCGSEAREAVVRP